MDSKIDRRRLVWLVVALALAGVIAAVSVSSNAASKEKRDAERACTAEIESRYAVNPKLADLLVFSIYEGRDGATHEVTVVDSRATFRWTCRATRVGAEWALDIWK